MYRYTQIIIIYNKYIIYELIAVFHRTNKTYYTRGTFYYLTYCDSWLYYIEVYEVHDGLK